MEENIFSVTLADGTVLSGLTMNGNNFVSDLTIDKSVFENNLSPVTITEGTAQTEIHSAMALIHATQMGDETWFALRDLTEAELAAIKTRSDIDYIAMMCDVDL